MFVLLASLALAADPFSLPATTTTLDNGLVVLLLEDHRTDTIALHLTYGVGGRDERPGERGCAHLFEHLMFQGSRGVPQNAFDAWLGAAGGSNNASTSADETWYYMAFPSAALDLALFLESDRMGFLDAGLLPETLSNQQDVVLQERARDYVEPNAWRDWDTQLLLMWPEGHPYRSSLSGTVADIEGFTLDGVRSFWQRHYHPRNAVLALVGNFESEQALERVRHWFGDVPDRGDPVPRLGPVRGGRTGQAAVIEDDVQQRMVYLSWETVDERSPDVAPLEVLAMILSGGQGTRLDDRLYHRSSLASSVGALSTPMDLSGTFEIILSSPDTPLPKLAKLVSDELARIASKPPHPAELERAKLALRTERLDGLELAEDKAEMLVECWNRTGDPDCARRDQLQIDDVTAEDVSRVARTWLLAKPNTLSNVPRGDAISALPNAIRLELP